MRYWLEDNPRLLLEVLKHSDYNTQIFVPLDEIHSERYFR